MDTQVHKQAFAWLEREMDLGLDAVLRPASEPVARAVAPPASARAEVDPPSPSRVALAVARGAQIDTPSRIPVSSAAGSTPVAGGRSTSLPELLVEPEVRGADSLGALREVLGDCRRCKLCERRTNIVFGVGNPDARLMFVGEGPGEDEDRLGEPFVGKAGELLTKIITSGMGLARSDVYIANVVKCRPPGNRNPEPDEIVACEPFLMRQIELVRPEVLVSLGTFATQALLRDRTPISRRRGVWHEVMGIPLMPTFHPAYLLRTPSDKRLVWEDIQLVMARLGLPLPPRRGAGA